ncbi:MAG: guanylate kinase [Gammaproteobacteria bacterium]|nr:guanylate kinase [Gammaproteobacteria bacterium]|tara:strand:+ start:3372 stop:3989 length:618 start_codon:yes stop_codon:yes gene_type:complete
MIDKKGTLLVISAPSGTGKTTVVKQLMLQNKNIKASVSYTTRTIRPNETNGLDYVFVTAKIFESMILQNMFLEFANVFGHYYGTPTKETLDALNRGYTIILEIDWQGAEQIRLQRPESKSIFLLPPSKEELKKRLTRRATDSSDQIELRFQEAIKDIQQYKYFDRVIVNNDVDSTCQEIVSYINKLDSSKQKVNEEALAVIRSFI